MEYRRIDDLGRVVIPKSIRFNLDITEGGHVENLHRKWAGDNRERAGRG